MLKIKSKTTRPQLSITDADLIKLEKTKMTTYFSIAANLNTTIAGNFLMTISFVTL